MMRPALASRAWMRHTNTMRTILAAILILSSLTACDQPGVAEPTPIVHVETRGAGFPITGCCECMTADNVTFWPECHSHKCEDQCVVGDPVKGCEWIDAELVCPEFVCP